MQEETGYVELQLVHELPRYDAKFFHGPKNVNRHAHFRCFLFEITNHDPIKLSGTELEKHEPVWLSEAEIESFRLPEGHRYLLDYIQTDNL